MYYLSWDLGSFFSNLALKGKEYGQYFVVFLGVILIIAGLYQIVKGLMSHGRGQTNWGIAAACILIGGFMAGITSWDSIQNFTNMGSATIDTLGHS